MHKRQTAGGRLVPATCGWPPAHNFDRWQADCVPVTGGRPPEHATDRRQTAATRLRQVAVCQRAFATGGRPPLHATDRWQFAGACPRWAAGPSHMPATGQWPQCMPATGRWLPAHAGDRRSHRCMLMTDRRSPAHASKLWKVTSACRQQAEVCWSAPVSDGSLLVHAGNRRKSAGLRW